MVDPVLDLAAAFPIVERAVAEHAKALEIVSVLQDYETYRNTCRSADSAQELAIAQIGATVRDNGYETSVRIAGIRSTSTMGLGGALRNWLTAAGNKLYELDACSSHVASHSGPKICGRCGMRIDELRLLEDNPADDPFNPHGSGPLPIEAREG